MYTISGSKSALEKRNYLLNNKSIDKIDGIFIGDYGTFIPKTLMNEYSYAQNNLNYIIKNNIHNIEIYNQHLKTITDITNKRITADNANIILKKYKYNKL